MNIETRHVVDCHQQQHQSHVVTELDGYQFLNDTIRDRIDIMGIEYAQDVVFIFEQNGGLELTYGELRKNVRRIAEKLLKFKFEKGDRLAFQLANSVETILITLACAYIGVLPVAIDPAFFDFQMEFMLEKANPKGFIVMSSFEGVFHFSISKKCVQNWSVRKKANSSALNLVN